MQIFPSRSPCQVTPRQDPCNTWRKKQMMRSALEQNPKSWATWSPLKWLLDQRGLKAETLTLNRQQVSPTCPFHDPVFPSNKMRMLSCGCVEVGGLAKGFRRTARSGYSEQVARGLHGANVVHLALLLFGLRPWKLGAPAASSRQQV